MDLSLVLIGIVMFIALIGMIVCSKKQKTNPNAQPVAIALLIIVVVCGFMMMYKTGVFGSGGAEQFRQIEDRHPVFSQTEELHFIWCIAGNRYWVGDKNKDFVTGKVDKLTT